MRLQAMLVLSLVMTGPIALAAPPAPAVPMAPPPSAATSAQSQDVAAKAIDTAVPALATGRRSTRGRAARPADPRQ